MTKTRIECATTSHTVEEGECPWCTIGRLRTALEKIRGWTQGDDYAVARVCNEALGALHPTMARILEAHDVPPQTPNTDLLSAAKGIVKLLEDVGNEVGWDAGSHTDRVYAWYEFDDLRAAIARIENRICQHDFQKPACTAIADDPRHAHCTVCGTTWMILSGEPTQHHEPSGDVPWFGRYQALVSACTLAGFRPEEQDDPHYGGKRVVLVPMQSAEKSSGEDCG